MPEQPPLGRADTMERVGRLEAVMARLDQALNSTDPSDQDQIAGLTAIVNGHSAILAAGTGHPRRLR